MGWEYHDRRRDKRGRFAADDLGGKVCRLQIRCSAADYARIRRLAYDAQMSISDYVLAVCGVNPLPRAWQLCRQIRDALR